jgi:poly [ADP-ribose] polymerase
MAKSATTTIAPAVDEKRYVKLVMVTGENNNKFYEMVYNGGNTFTAKWGRIELTEKSKQYPYDDWNAIYREKTKKGYKDVSAMVAVDVAEEKTAPDKYAVIKNTAVKNFIELMRKYTDDLVKKTYSVKADKVSRKQVDEAQSILDELVKMDHSDEEKVNTRLIELYGIIPRFMKNVRDHILPTLDLKKALTQEQDNLDAMSSQVASIEKSKAKQARAALKKGKGKIEAEPEAQTYVQAMGLDMFEASEDGKKNFKDILDQLKGKKILGIYEIKKSAEDEIFDAWLKKQKNSQTRHLIHGTRCTSVIPILREGLKIRPVGNFQFSGKVYGDGNYFSEITTKSLGYTGYDEDQILLVYEVHTGNPFTYEGWYHGNKFALNYAELSKRGFDSTYVKAGGGLRNSEIIAYREEQARIKYLIHVKR